MNAAEVNLYLVGFMGTGKTTVGRIVAQRLGFNCLDSDKEIEKLEQQIKDFDYGQPPMFYFG